ncbi:Ala-tRNA(Pro) hydrolase [Chromatiales bacterium (ex Bugula neritina AB1)]|nr:Ala-tRNA(Pro) hydrolase [Chromatiales bacterium (ex Bugula neritina AB1)]
MTLEIFREDAYARQCESTVTAVDSRGIQLNQTVFYPNGGGQPGDTGSFVLPDGSEIAFVDTIKDRDSGEHIHCVANETDLSRLQVGTTGTAKIDWDRRYRLMRMHSCLHMLCAVIPASVTGGSIQEQRGRLDFNLPDTVDKEKVTADLNQLIASNTAMSMQWITDEELDANPGLVRTLSAPPPRGSGRVRLVNFEGIDLQPCGGTHVAATAEIGKVRVQKIEKKGKMNRRVIVVFDDEAPV